MIKITCECGEELEVDEMLDFEACGKLQIARLDMVIKTHVCLQEPHGLNMVEFAENLFGIKSRYEKVV